MKKNEHWTIKYFIDLCLWVILAFAAFILMLWLSGCSTKVVWVEGRDHVSRDSCLLHLANVESALTRPDVIIPGQPMRYEHHRAWVKKKREECLRLP